MGDTHTTFGKPLAPTEAIDLLKLYAIGGKETDLNAPTLNAIAYESTLADLMNLYMGVFTWEGLPKGVSTRQVEYWLMTGGIVAFTRDPVIAEAQPIQAPEGYACVRCYLTGEIDLYDLPENISAYSMVAAVNGMNLNPDNTVLIWDSLLRASPLPRLAYYARRLSNIDRSIDVNVSNQKTTKVVRGTRKQLLGLKNAMDQQQGNQVLRWEDSTAGDREQDPVSYDATAPYVASDLQLLKRQLLSEILTFSGIDNSYGDKRERMITGEVEQGAGETNAHKLSRQAPRDTAAKEIGERFGLEVTCRLSADVRADDRAEEAQVEGPQEGPQEGDDRDDG